MRPLPDKTIETIRFVLKHLENKGYPPSVREIGKNIGLSSPGSTWKMMQKCERRGLIEIDPNVPRGIRITELGKELAGGAPGRI